MTDLANVAEGVTQHLEIHPARTFHKRVFVTDDARVAVALDGWDGKAQVRDADDRLLLELTVVVSQATGGATTGQMDMTATALATAAMTADGRYDLTLYRTVDDEVETKVVRQGDVVRVPVETRL